MNAFDQLPEAVADVFGAGATAEEAYGLITVDVPVDAWTAALETARDTLGCTYFDWLSAVDEPETGFQVCTHLVALPDEDTGLHRLLLRTTVPHDAPALPTATGVYAGAAWHERETHEMFGIDFDDHPNLVPLLLPDGFEGHPLRKDFVLAARVAKPWPGAKGPGGSTAAPGGSAAAARGGSAAGGGHRQRPAPRPRTAGEEATSPGPRTADARRRRAAAGAEADARSTGRRDDGEGGGPGERRA